jgi:phospholipid-transporting ATPase
MQETTGPPYTLMKEDKTITAMNSMEIPLNPSRTESASSYQSDVPAIRSVLTNRPAQEMYVNNSIRTAKYTNLNFLPKNLVEQFSKAANVYFLVIGLLQLIKEISTTNGSPVMFFPLSVIITVTAIKDFFEDWKRRSSDQAENTRKTEVLTEVGFMPYEWQNLHVGHIIRVKKDEYVPADILILNTSEPKGICYIETKNLDGETNLKHKVAHKDVLRAFPANNLSVEADFLYQFEPPNVYLYQFTGSNPEIRVDSP